MPYLAVNNCGDMECRPLEERGWRQRKLSPPGSHEAGTLGKMTTLNQGNFSRRMERGDVAEFEVLFSRRYIGAADE